MSIELSVTYNGQRQTLEVDDEKIILFPEGLVGFAEWRRFVLLEDPNEAPLGILQCLDDVEVSFLVTDPWSICPDYDLGIALGQVSELGLERAEDAQVLCTLAIQERPLVVTADLLGPIIVNPRTRLARQIVLQHSQYSAQHPVLSVEGVSTGGKQ